MAALVGIPQYNLLVCIALRLFVIICDLNLEVTNPISVILKKGNLVVMIEAEMS
jgi:hypothetical protein